MGFGLAWNLAPKSNGSQTGSWVSCKSTVCLLYQVNCCWKCSGRIAFLEGACLASSTTSNQSCVLNDSEGDPPMTLAGIGDTVSWITCLYTLNNRVCWRADQCLFSMNKWCSRSELEPGNCLATIEVALFANLWCTARHGCSLQDPSLFGRRSISGLIFLNSWNLSTLEEFLQKSLFPQKVRKGSSPALSSSYKNDCFLKEKYFKQKLTTIWDDLIKCVWLLDKNNLCSSVALAGVVLGRLLNCWQYGPLLLGIVVAVLWPRASTMEYDIQSKKEDMMRGCS